MNLLKSPLRRTTAIVAGAFLGLAGAVATAAPAMATDPDVTGAATCVAEDGWKVMWTVTNTWPNEGEVKEVVLTPEGATLTGDIKVGAKLEKNGGNKLVGAVTVPADVDKATLRVAVTFDNDHDGGGEAQVNRPTEKCAPETSETPEQPAPADPIPLLEADCDSMTIGLDNPEDGAEITLEFKTSTGEERTLTVKPGEKKTETFSATEGFSVTVTAEGLDGGSQTIEYEQPEECAAGGAGAGAGGPELPLTGAAAGSIAGGAALLLAMGGVLFFLARRRKVKFTA